MQNLQAMQQAMQSAAAAPAAPAASPEPAAPAPEAMAQDPAMQENPVESALNALPEDQKAFVAEHLTPEVAQLFGMVLGNPQITELMMPFVDAERILVPVPRAEFENMLQSKSTGAESAAPAAPMPSTPMVGAGAQPQQQAATPTMMGPA
jgi:hypothetical protein